jgi:cobalt-zinc-cadmium efflux system outer membrane protein
MRSLALRSAAACALAACIPAAILLPPQLVAQAAAPAAPAAPAPTAPAPPSAGAPTTSAPAAPAPATSSPGARAGAAARAGQGAQQEGANQQNGQQAQGNLADQTVAGEGLQTTGGVDPRKPPPSRPGALTLAQVIEAARTHNPTLLAAAQNLRAVRAQELQAGVRANPYLGIAGQGVTLSPDGQNPFTYSVQVSRLFERGDKRHWRLDAAYATSAQTLAQLQDTERLTIYTVKQAFTTMIMAKATLALAQANLKEFTRELQINKDRLDAGDIDKLDYERLDLQFGSFENDQATAEITVQQAADQLQNLMGLDTPLPTFDITGDIVPPRLVQTQADLLQMALTNRPDYAAARAGVNVAVAQQRLAVANGTADPTIESEYDRIGHDNSAGFSVNLPLRLFDRNQGNKETARYTADATRLTETAARNQVISDVDQAYVQYVKSSALSDRFGSHYLDEATDVLSISQFSYEHGGLALTDYLEALRETRATTTAALSAYQNTWLAIHQLSSSTATELVP